MCASLCMHMSAQSRRSRPARPSNAMGMYMQGAMPCAPGAGVTGAGVTGAGVTGAGLIGAGLAGTGLTGVGVTGAGVTGAGVTGAGLLGTGVLPSGAAHTKTHKQVGSKGKLCERTHACVSLDAHTCACVRVRASVRACVCVCVRACVRA